ncbi:MAG: PaaX family transcriptional regulator C-terminal domain-containing protein [Actinomycetes bacterium]|jgi:phenylacetic acid degradation operon negative regulatory protein|uniref:Unannotated protein n=1 Tax=freshwater metagenome TaxID=449393 RepID=A0A6J6EF77_9ZZZZ|nr:transcriptional regulator [Actinomycetota bacterium]
MTRPERAGRTPSTLSSRSLVLALVDERGTLRAADAFDVGAALGCTVHQIRLVLSRLVDEGLLTSVGRGRHAVLTATDRHEHLHGPEPEWLAAAFRQDDGDDPWDGRWRTISFTLGEDRRVQRHELRDALVSLGAASLMPGVYVHGADWSHWLDETIERLGVRDAVVTAEITAWTVHGRSDPREIAAHLWPLSDTADGYRAFLERHGPVGATSAIDDPTAALAEAVEAVADFERCIRNDPLLPYELLPDDWPGRAARDLLVDIALRLRAARERTGLPRLFVRYDELIVGRGASRPSAAVTH